MTRTIAVNRALFNNYFPSQTWLAGEIVHKMEYFSRVEFSEATLRERLGRFLVEQKLNFRSALYRFHLVMAPEIMEDEEFKRTIDGVMRSIGVHASFVCTCTRGDSSFLVGKVYAKEVELIEYCDILITGISR